MHSCQCVNICLHDLEYNNNFLMYAYYIHEFVNTYKYFHVYFSKYNTITGYFKYPTFYEIQPYNSTLNTESSRVMMFTKYNQKTFKHIILYILVIIKN